MTTLNVRNCPKCGRIFTFAGNPICPRCQEEEEEVFETVRRYIKDNGNESIEQVAEATGVTVKKILRYIKAGKIELVGCDGGIQYPCERCGKLISKGSYCSSCTNKIKDSLNSNFKKPVEEKKKTVLYSRLNR